LGHYGLGPCVTAHNEHEAKRTKIKILYKDVSRGGGEGGWRRGVD